MPAEGLVTIASAFDQKDTLNRLKAGIAAQELDLFAEIDHAENAKDAALTLSPATVLVFGNAKAGTPLIKANQAIGLDLPLKALVWQDAAGKTWISYNDPVWLAHRYRVPADAMEIAGKMRAGLESLASKAAGG